MVFHSQGVQPLKKTQNRIYQRLLVELSVSDHTKASPTMIAVTGSRALILTGILDGLQQLSCLEDSASILLRCSWVDILIVGEISRHYLTADEACTHQS